MKVRNNLLSLFQVMEGHTGPILSLIIVNKLMYSSSIDNTAKCWIRQFGDCTATYAGHKYPVVCVRFYKGIGKYLITHFLFLSSI